MMLAINMHRAAAFLLLLWSKPTISFLLNSFPCRHHHHHTVSSSSTSLASDVSDLLYQEQENIIIRRGELEDTFVTNAKPLEASKVKIRGAGE